MAEKIKIVLALDGESKFSQEGQRQTEPNGVKRIHMCRAVAPSHRRFDDAIIKICQSMKSPSRKSGV